MTKRTKLEETFDLPPLSVPDPDVDAEDVNNEVGIADEEMQVLIAKADKIDAALPQVGGLDTLDSDYDNYAQKAIDAFSDLLDLSKNVEDRHAAELANAASSMLTNALNAKTQKANRKMDTIKQQLAKAKLEHEKEKLEFSKEKYLRSTNDEDGNVVESEGKVVASRTDIIRDLLEEMKNNDD
jgi:hypothetical protein